MRFVKNKRTNKINEKGYLRGEEAVEFLNYIYYAELKFMEEVGFKNYVFLRMNQYDKESLKMVNVPSFYKGWNTIKYIDGDYFYKINFNLEERGFYLLIEDIHNNLTVNKFCKLGLK